MFRGRRALKLQETRDRPVLAVTQAAQAGSTDNHRQPSDIRPQRFDDDMAHAVFVAVYCVLVLVVLVVALFSFRAWQQFRRTMREVLQRRHDRDLERGAVPNHTDNYWIGPLPPRLAGSYPEARPVAFSPTHKPVAPLLPQASPFRGTAIPATTEL
jgi:hypothetical protein